MKNEDSGFVKIHRKILEWPWYLDINTKVLFIHMLLEALNNAALEVWGSGEDGSETDGFTEETDNS